ncbi:MAG TPA: carboxypeptidase regulatory-like domain-containing protein, partial [Gemmataceae bacterium]|nr:carboxypeptidase regulatory-like domain-containing protein [Gemmataceae bacterium]
MERSLRTVFAMLLVAVSMPGLLHSQTATGGVNGTITDPAKAAVPGATVTLRNTATNLQTTANSNSSGFFTFVNVQPGPYTLSVTHPGFKAVRLPEFTVGVNQTVTQDLALTLGQVNETVTVEAQAKLIQQSSAELGTIVPEKAVKDLPLNGRNFTQLLTLTPGATPVSTSQGASIGTNDGNTVALPQSGFSNPSIHGQWNRSSIYFLDGIINTDFRTTTYTLLPDVDLIEEFKVQSHNDKAEYGGVAGGVINVVSKSGGNQFHGSVFEFVRNDFFNARDTLVEGKRNSPFPFRQNQFGATFSGPIFKNKTFFSGGYDGWRYSKPVGTLIVVPTAAEISGDFSHSIIGRNIYDPATTGPDPNNPSLLTRQQFQGNIIPPSRISPMMQGFIK